MTFFLPQGLRGPVGGTLGRLNDFWAAGDPKMNFFGVKILTFWTENMIFSRWCLVDIGTIPRS